MFIETRDYYGERGGLISSNLKFPSSKTRRLVFRSTYIREP